MSPLFRSNPEKEKGNKPENDVGDPNGDQGGQVTKCGENGENLHEQDVNEGEGQPESQVKPDPASNLAA